MAKFEDKKSDQVTLHKSIHIAETMWKDSKDILYCNGSFYQWEGRIYKKIDDIDWMILVSIRFPAFNEIAPRTQREIMEVYKRFSKIPLEDLNALDGLCFNNKYLDLKDISAHDHDQKRLSTILIPYDYDSKAQCPLWDATIKDIFEIDVNKILSLQEFFGYCLTRDTSQEKAMFLFGEGGTGKSVILETLQNMIGQGNVSFVSLRHFNDSIRMASLQSKLINISTEVPKRAEDYEETYKKVASGEFIDVSPKYIAPFSFRPFCKMIFAINEWPHIDDKTQAFFRRMLIIELEKVYDEEMQDKILKTKLISELPGILNWAIKGLERIREKNNFTQNEYMKIAVREVRMQNNPVALFAAEMLRISDGSEIGKHSLYKEYSAWCGINGYKSAGSARFGTEIYRIFRASTDKESRSTEGQRVRVWKNLVLKVYGEEQEAIKWED